MTARDRTVLTVLGAVAALAAFWLVAISPKRKESADLGAQLRTAHQRLQTAQAAAADAANAKARFASDYATVARLGKAVPVKDDVPALVYQLQTTADQTHVDFRKIALDASAAPPQTTLATQKAAVAVAAGSTTTPGTTSPASAASSALPPGATVGAAGFPTMPFAFSFNGSFFNLQRFLDRMNDLTTVDGSHIAVKGRLLTIDGVTLTAGPQGFPQVAASVDATAYMLPADEGLTAGATAGGPAGTPTTATASTTTTTPSATSSLKGTN